MEALGFVVKNSNSDTYVADVKMYIGKSVYDLNPVTYTEPATLVVDSITPNYASVLGGELITIKGGDYDPSDITIVTFDGIVCEVQTVTTEEITCITGPKYDDVDNLNTDTSITDYCQDGSKVWVR